MNQHHFKYRLVDLNGFKEVFDPKPLEIGQYIINQGKYYEIREIDGNVRYAFSKKFIKGEVDL